ncbi:hypothetical protein OO015_02765 [Thermomicrobium sp. 4228-Ro]|uniref:hypothetical protein n=1 Tax=Thermomicrobium sp. 4228-Ro TaxID=2993937 RepID=UPI0022494D3D|nr:hypothetical protein [Thermomicrobium sp. 4228-Ro]MCX2726414.1 hypothetical protein [Thermomicrobium sp. 4228-Ro]
MGTDWAALAAMFRERVREATGHDLDFSLESLAVLDDLLDEWLYLAQVYGSERPHDLSELEQPLIAYVGETLRQNFGGQWVERPTGSVLRISHAIDLDLRPLVQATLVHQHPPSFARLASALERELEERAWK